MLGRRGRRGRWRRPVQVAMIAERKRRIVTIATKSTVLIGLRSGTEIRPAVASAPIASAPIVCAAMVRVVAPRPAHVARVVGVAGVAGVAGVVCATTPRLAPAVRAGIAPRLTPAHVRGSMRRFASGVVRAADGYGVRLQAAAIRVHKWARSRCDHALGGGSRLWHRRRARKCGGSPRAETAVAASGAGRPGPTATGTTAPSTGSELTICAAATARSRPGADSRLLHAHARGGARRIKRRRLKRSLHRKPTGRTSTCGTSTCGTSTRRMGRTEAAPRRRRSTRR